MKGPERRINIASMKMEVIGRVIVSAPATTAPRASPTLNIVERYADAVALIAGGVLFARRAHSATALIAWPIP